MPVRIRPTGTPAADGARAVRASGGDGRLRFCMVTTFYPPHNFGGDGVGIQRLARALVRRGHEVTVVHDVDAYNARHRGPAPAAGEDDEGVRVVRLKSGLGTLSPLLTQQLGRPVANRAALRKLLADGSFDVIHYNNISLVGGPGVLAYGRAVKVYEAHEHWLVCPSHVLWRHGQEPCDRRECLRCVLHARRPPQLWRYTGLLERHLRHVDVFIAKSEFSRRKHHEFGFPRDMEVLPYFLPDPVPGTQVERARSAQLRPYFLFVGRLERIKGLDDVLPLFRAYEDADLVVAGEGEYGEHLRQLAAGNPRVRFLGHVPLEKLGELYAGATALIVPSVCFETFGIILIEAFRRGTPVIARRIGPFPEIVDRAGAGLLFDDAAGLLAAMRRLQADAALRADFARRGFDAFRRHWCESAVVPRYLELVGAAAAVPVPARRNA